MRVNPINNYPCYCCSYLALDGGNAIYNPNAIKELQTLINE